MHAWSGTPRWRPRRPQKRRSQRTRRSLIWWALSYLLRVAAHTLLVRARSLLVSARGVNQPDVLNQSIAERPARCGKAQRRMDFCCLAGPADVPVLWSRDRSIQPADGHLLLGAARPAFRRSESLSFRRSISQRPATPGGAAIRYAADIAMM